MKQIKYTAKEELGYELRWRDLKWQGVKKIDIITQRKGKYVYFDYPNISESLHERNSLLRDLESTSADEITNGSYIYFDNGYLYKEAGNWYFHKTSMCALSHQSREYHLRAVLNSLKRNLRYEKRKTADLLIERRFEEAEMQELKVNELERQIELVNKYLE